MYSIDMMNWGLSENEAWIFYTILPSMASFIEIFSHFANTKSQTNAKCNVIPILLELIGTIDNNSN
jgi:hypothetical protein